MKTTVCELTVAIEAANLITGSLKHHPAEGNNGVSSFSPPSKLHLAADNVIRLVKDTERYTSSSNDNMCEYHEPTATTRLGRYREAKPEQPEKKK